MTWLLIILILGIVVTVTLWGIFAYIAVRGTKSEIPDASFGTWLDLEGVEQPRPVKILLAIDGSAPSVAAVHEVAHRPLPSDSAIELLYAIHSRLPVIPDFPPWAVTVAAAHGESIREQTRDAPKLLQAAAKHLQAHQPHVAIVTKTVEGRAEGPDSARGGCLGGGQNRPRFTRARACAACHPWNNGCCCCGQGAMHRRNCADPSNGDAGNGQLACVSGRRDRLGPERGSAWRAEFADYFCSLGGALLARGLIHPARASLHTRAGARKIDRTQGPPRGAGRC